MVAPGLVIDQTFWVVNMKVPEYVRVKGVDVAVRCYIHFDPIRSRIAQSKL